MFNFKVIYLNIQNVYINGKKTGLAVDGFDIANDDIYLSVHRKEDEFKNMMSKIGNPDLKATQKIENNMRKILNAKAGWSVSDISFNFGYVTFVLTHPTRITYMDVANQLGISCDRENPKVVPLMKIGKQERISSFWVESWIYSINCRDEYFRDKDGWPEKIDVMRKTSTFGV